MKIEFQLTKLDSDSLYARIRFVDTKNLVEFDADLIKVAGNLIGGIKSLKTKSPNLISGGVGFWDGLGGYDFNLSHKNEIYYVYDTINRVQFEVSLFEIKSFIESIASELAFEIKINPSLKREVNRLIESVKNWEVL